MTAHFATGFLTSKTPDIRSLRKSETYTHQSKPLSKVFIRSTGIQALPSTVNSIIITLNRVHIKKTRESSRRYIACFTAIHICTLILYCNSIVYLEIFVENIFHGYVLCQGFCALNFMDYCCSIHGLDHIVLSIILNTSEPSSGNNL